MERSAFWFTLAVALALLGVGLSKQALAANCGEPAPAPKYQVGDKWTWKNERGVEASEEVIAVEAEFAQIKWSSGDVGLYDKDFILREVLRKSGEIVTQQGTTYATINVKTLDFPLQTGRRWEYSFMGQPRVGTGSLLSYTNRLHILSCEEVTTPAGKFAALKVELDQYLPGATEDAIMYRWYSPQVKTFVKRQYKPSRRWGSQFLDNELIKFEGK